MAVVDDAGGLLGTVDLRTIMTAVETGRRTPDADRDGAVDSAADEVAAR